MRDDQIRPAGTTRAGVCKGEILTMNEVRWHCLACVDDCVFVTSRNNQQSEAKRRPDTRQQEKKETGPSHIDTIQQSYAADSRASSISRRYFAFFLAPS